MSIDFFKYDFLDFGSSKGDSMAFARRCLGGEIGLGVDFDPRKIEEARAAGHDCICANLTQIELPEGCTRFVVISHLLEHLWNLTEAQSVIASARKVARDFIYIRGPWFDADEYLAELGLKFYWSDWYEKGHRLHLTCSMLETILLDLRLTNYHLLGRELIRDSSHSTIHSVAAPPNQHHYSEPLHGAKPHVKFDRPLFREMVCVIFLRDLPDRHTILSGLDQLHPIERSDTTV